MIFIFRWDFFSFSLVHHIYAWERTTILELHCRGIEAYRTVGEFLAVSYLKKKEKKNEQDQGVGSAQRSYAARIENRAQ